MMLRRSSRLQTPKPVKEEEKQVLVCNPPVICDPPRKDKRRNCLQELHETASSKTIKTKAKSSRNVKRPKKDRDDVQESAKSSSSYDSSDDELISSLKVKKVITKKKTVRKKRKKDSTPKDSNAQRQTKDLKHRNDAVNGTSIESSPYFEVEVKKIVTKKKVLDGSEFAVEYSKSGRASCKRCNETILKDDLRVANRPLFRGKPGFTIYRHLKCAIFSETVHCAEDVGGHDDLKVIDYNFLVRRVNESKAEIKKEMEELEEDDLVNTEFDGEKRPPPHGLNANLLPFQVNGFSWMYHQEVKMTEIRGGILADDMGMGKTIQTIAAILDNRPKLQISKPGAKFPPSITDKMKKDLQLEEDKWMKSNEDWKHEMEMNDISNSIRPTGKKAGTRGGTLVICPLIAISQWKSEIEKFCYHNSLSVAIYHGGERSSKTPQDMLTKYDVILTTYQTVGMDYRKMVSPNRVKCPNCGGKFKIDKLRVHLKYFCGDGAERTEAQSRQRRRSNPVSGQSGRRMSSDNDSMNGNNAKDDTKKKFQAKAKNLSKEKKKKILQKKSSKGPNSKNKIFLKNGKDEEVSIPLSTAKRNPSPRHASSRARIRLAAQAAQTRNKDSDSNSDDSYSVGKNISEDSTEDDMLPIEKEKDLKATTYQKRKRFTDSGSKKGKLSPVSKGKGKHNMKQKEYKPLKNAPDEDSEDSENSEIDDVDMNKLIEEAMTGAQMSVLHSICWWRIVLDEAHMIKSRSSQTAQAAFSLIGIHRWCLTGTPLQNRVGEFYSLIRFLRQKPMGYYYCKKKGCTCSSVHYRMMDGKCKGCGHSSIQHYSHFNKFVLNPIQRDGYRGDGRRAMFVLKDEVLDKCLLRRTKETKAEDMNLPPRLVTIQRLRLHPIEEDFYNALYTKTRSSFNDYVEDGTLLNNYAHIFDLLMRMRQSVCHPYLVLYSKKAAISSSGQVVTGNGTTDCELCHSPLIDRVVSSCCQGVYCKSCVLEYMETSAGIGSTNGTPCPSCRSAFSIDLNQAQHPVDEDNLQKLETPLSISNAVSTINLPSLREMRNVASGSILRRIDLARFATSTKIEALTQDLLKMRMHNPCAKAIVFSQFVNMLDLIRWRLHSDPCLSDMGLGARTLHGSMNLKARDEVLKEFREDRNVKVLLISLKAGGVALNLTVANYIYLMDPWWNPAAEMQAIDRTHRIGQYRPIKVVRFIAENTVEERILQLQEKKRLVFDGTVGRDAGSLQMLTSDDMKTLFT